MPLPIELAKAIIGSKHDDYTANLEVWQKNELFFRGDKAVYDSLKKFTWETVNPTLYEDRKAEAAYINFPGLMAEKFNGTLFASAPEPDFGHLGELGGDTETEADQLFNSFDGTGPDARSWDMFWYDSMFMAPSTSHRWIFVEAPSQKAETKADEKNGLRPYGIEFSPTVVPNWDYDGGKLNWLYVKLTPRVIVPKGGGFEIKKEDQYYIMIRDGYTEFGEVPTGWFFVNEKGEPIVDANGNPKEGTWEKTNGEIPMVKLYYEQGRANKDSEGLTHLVRLALKYLNQNAALDHDVWTSGSRKRYFLGTDPSQWATIVEKSLDGGTDIPVPQGKGGGKVDIYDTGSVTASEGIMSVMEITLSAITTFMMRELTTAPTASGEARKMDMKTGKAPRLSHMARNLEEAQREVIRFMELRWGYSDPKGTVTWPRTFDLRSVAEKIDEALTLMVKGGASSPTLISDLIVKAVRDLGIEPTPDDENDDPMSVIVDEIKESSSRSAQADSLLSDVLSPSFN